MSSSDPKSHLKLNPVRPFITTRSALAADAALLVVLATTLVALT